MKAVNKKEIIRFVRFAFVGIIGAIIDFSIFNLETSLLGIPTLIAQAVSFTVAVISNFIWNRYWTYPDSRSKKISAQVVQFFVVNIVGLIIRTFLISWTDPLLLTFLGNSTLPFHMTAAVAARNIALAFAVGIVMLWNFFINRIWTYSDVK